MSKYYTPPTPILSGSTARADDVNNVRSAMDVALEMVEADFDRTIKVHPSSETGGLTLPNQTLADAFLYFDGDGDLSLLPKSEIDLLVARAEDAANAAQGSVSDAQTIVDNGAVQITEILARAESSATDAAASVSQGQSFATAAEDAATAAASSQQAADNILTDCETVKSEVEGQAELARQWANDPEDQVVAGGKYSAKHWAAKAEAIATQDLDTVYLRQSDAQALYLAKLDAPTKYAHVTVDPSDGDTVAYSEPHPDLYQGAATEVYFNALAGDCSLQLDSDSFPDNAVVNFFLSTENVNFALTAIGDSAVTFLVDEEADAQIIAPNAIIHFKIVKVSNAQWRLLVV